MKARLYLMLTLTIGLALLFTWAAAAQKAEVTGDAQSASPVISTVQTEFDSSYQNTESLGYTSDITFTSTFTTYLPTVFKDYSACSTIPTLISPTNGSNLSTIIPLFGWDSGNDSAAIHGKLQFAKDPGFTQLAYILLHSPAKGVWEFRFPFNFEPATTYYWRARLECEDTQGPYSEGWSFTTGSGSILPGPTLIAPINGTKVRTTRVTFQWSPEDGAIEYALKVGGEGGYGLIWVTGTQVTLRLSPNTTYKWWVSARSEYAFGADSEKWQFTTEDGPSFVSPQDLNRTFVVEDSSTILVFERRESK